MAFQVIPSSVPASAQEWQRAMSAHVSELPELDEIQRDEVRRLSMGEEEYRRYRVLLRDLVRQKQERQGREFGELIEGIIAGSGYQVSSVGRRGTPLGWRVTMRHPEKGVVEFQSPFDVVESLVARSATVQQVSSFREQILEELSSSNRIEVAS